MAARAPGTVSSISRFHLRTRWGGHNTHTRRNPAMCAAAARNEGLACAHFADDGGAAVRPERQGGGPDGVGLGPER